MFYCKESDSIGVKQVPIDAYYGVQSLRGQENFQITGNGFCLNLLNLWLKLKRPVLFAITMWESWMRESKMQSAKFVTRFWMVSTIINLFVIQFKAVQALPPTKSVVGSWWKALWV